VNLKRTKTRLDFFEYQKGNRLKDIEIRRDEYTYIFFKMYFRNHFCCNRLC